MTAELESQTIPVGQGHVTLLTLNRPHAANALSQGLAQTLTQTFIELASDVACRLVVLCGKGAHFCGGADLVWMQASAKLDAAGNLAEAHGLTALYEAMASCSIPLVGVVRGSAYGGAVGLLACCDVVVAEEKSRFCLSEVRLGILPAVIMPYLVRKMTPGRLRRLALSGAVFSAAEACECGLVHVVAEEESFSLAVRRELDGLLAGGPLAQRQIKGLLAHFVGAVYPQGELTARAIASARSGAEGQEGLASFFGKTAPAWHTRMPEDFSL